MSAPFPSRPLITGVTPEAFRQDLLALLQRHLADGVTVQETVATAAFATGMLIAYCPSGEMTQHEAMTLVLENLAAGNRHAVEKAIAAHGGRQ